MARSSNDGFRGKTNMPVTGDVLGPFAIRGRDEVLVVGESVVVRTKDNPPSGGLDWYPGYLSFWVSPLVDGKHDPQAEVFGANIGNNAIKGIQHVTVVRQMRMTFVEEEPR